MTKARIVDHIGSRLKIESACAQNKLQPLTESTKAAARRLSLLAATRRRM
jgi:hypothetical protein